MMPFLMKEVLHFMEMLLYSQILKITVPLYKAIVQIITIIK